jgi:hypothetical protein
MTKSTESRFVRRVRSMVRRAADDVGRVSCCAAFGSADSTRSSDSVALNPAVRVLGPEAAITSASVRLPNAFARQAVLVRPAPTASAPELRPTLTCTFRGVAFDVVRIIDARVSRRWAL